MKTEPSPPPFTIKRGTQYWYNRKIPVDLIPAYSGKRLIRHRLNVGKRKDAEERATARTAELNVEFKRKRRELDSQQSASLAIAIPPKEIELDEEQIRRLCLLWQRSVLETDDQNRIGGFVETDYDDLRENLTDAEPALRQALARGSFDVIAPALHSFLFLCRVHVDEKSVAYKQLQHQFLQSIIQTIELQKGRLNGEVVRTDTVAPVSEVFKPKQTQPSEGVLGINELFELWKSAVSKRPLSTVSAFGTAANQFGAFVGDVPMSQITRKIVIRFRDKLKNEDGLNYKTIETKMALLSAMFQIAVDAEILESNPASRIKVAKPKNGSSRVSYGRQSG